MIVRIAGSTFLMGDRQNQMKMNRRSPGTVTAGGSGVECQMFCPCVGGYRRQWVLEG